MNKFRFIATIIMTVLILIALSFGIYVISRKNMGVLNSTIFIREDDNVFVDVSYSYEGPELAERYSSNYTGGFTLRKEDDSSLDDDPLYIPTWTLGTTTFTVTERYIKLSFKITNLNDEYALKVTFENLAYDAEEKFTTSYNIVTGQDAIFDDDNLFQIQTGNNNKAKLNAIKIEPGQTKKIQLVYELKKLEQAFEFNNDIKCILETIKDI